MKRVFSIVAASVLALTPLTASAGGHGVTDQSYKAGKYSSTSSATSSASMAMPLDSCPREFRGMYRGTLYCRQPQYQVIAPRSAHCPEHASVMYRGNLYCVSGQG